ncbi:TonB-dependent receptor [Permianibacter sp. IMCC34836]|uniref:TonB-dependent receptor domain-containing protein n=1 Tax=Permianibacter fluminis TaxID=2738515 RepID=UPI0015557847|nr:TonB-dependent receptor [Permianibacter fluminis]NQD37071.1 TonB-dependent receptor [Permianibacter fluminis]
MSDLTATTASTRWSLFAMTALALAIPSAYAADAADDGSAERVEITGSRIKRVDVEGVNPVYTIDRSGIEKSGVGTIGELLQEMPTVSGAATNPQVNNGGGDGASKVSLRGLGEDRTLLLLNGRRMLTQDINSIPLALVDRIEVLKDGASAIYGSDAIAGVVNVITRKNFTGVEVTATYGRTSEDDGHRNQVEVINGVNSDSGNLVFGMNYTKQGAISAADRDFSRVDRQLYDGAVYETGSPTPPWGRTLVPIDAATAAGADLSSPACTLLDLDGDDVNDAVYLTTNHGSQGTAGSDYRCFIFDGAGNDSYNYQTTNLVLTPQERKHFFVQGTYNLPHDIEYYGYASYVDVEAHAQIAPAPQNGLVIDASNPFNPFGVTLDLDNGIRMELTGPRITEVETSNIEMTNGLRGSIGSWDWDVYYSWSEQKQLTTNRGFVYSTPLLNALGPAFQNGDGSYSCGTVGNPIANCTPVNLYNLDPSDPAVAQLLTQIQPHTHDVLAQHQQVAEATITGDLIELPAGLLALAAGYQWRWTDYDFDPDFLAVQRTVDGIENDPIFGEYDISELYFELNVPLLANVPGAELLELNIGSRASDYSTFGRTTNSKVSLLYKPWADLKIRSTWAEVFRSPTMTDLYTGRLESAAEFTDPCTGLTQAIVDANPHAAEACVGVPRNGNYNSPFDQLTAIQSGNADLSPETGTMLTFGMLYQPSFLSNLSTTIDWFHVELEDTISTVGTQNILDLCFSRGLYCDRIHRDAFGSWSEGNSQIDDPTSNVGALDVEGIDWNIRYLFDETAFGRFKFNLDATYFIKYDKEAVAGVAESLVENAGLFVDQSRGGDGHFGRVRALATLDWSLGDWDASWTMRYIHSVRESGVQADECLSNTAPADWATDCPNADPSDRVVPAYLYHDLQVSWAASALATRFSLGVENLTDKQPPRLYTGFEGDTDFRTYDNKGRFLYLRATTTF